MMIHGHPIVSPLLDEAQGLDRFWYWQGASGRRYIHSVYPVAACPPLPGAVFVAVRRAGRVRTAVQVGRLPARFEAVPRAGIRPDAGEIHVHLLAASEPDAAAILADLSAAFGHHGWGSRPSASASSVAS